MGRLPLATPLMVTCSTPWAVSTSCSCTTQQTTNKHHPVCTDNKQHNSSLEGELTKSISCCRINHTQPREATRRACTSGAPLSPTFIVTWVKNKTMVLISQRQSAAFNRLKLLTGKLIHHISLVRNQTSGGQMFYQVFVFPTNQQMNVHDKNSTSTVDMDAPR